MKKISTLFALAAVAANAWAQYETPGDGVTYTFESLSAIEGSGVTATGEQSYLISENLTISEGDTLRLLDNDEVSMANGVQVIISGEALFNPAEGAVIKAADEESRPVGFRINGSATFANLDMSGGGIHYLGTSPITVEDCVFHDINSESSSYGVIVVNNGIDGNVVRNCNFKDCEPGAVNVPVAMSGDGVGIVIENCVIENVSTLNELKPYINLAASPTFEVKVLNNVLNGAQLQKPGGIGVSNMLNLAGDNKVTVEGNYVENCSWGLNFVGGMDVRILNNEVKSNRWDPEDNGSFSVSLYSIASYPMNAYLEGNIFEDNKWGVWVLGASAANLGKVDDPEAEDYNPGNNTFTDNMFVTTSGATKHYELSNYTGSQVYAQGNTWCDCTTEEEVLALVEGSVIVSPLANSDSVRGSFIDNCFSGEVEVFDLNGVSIFKGDASSIKSSGVKGGVYVVKGSNGAMTVRF